MNVAISFSKAEHDSWTVEVDTYRELIRRLRIIAPNDAVVVQHLTMAGFFGGISIDREWEESPELTARVVRHLIATTHSWSKELESTPQEIEEKQPIANVEQLHNLLMKFAVGVGIDDLPIEPNGDSKAV